MYSSEVHHLSLIHISIASRCGFENLSYCNRAFKAHFGICLLYTSKYEELEQMAQAMGAELIVNFRFPDGTEV